MSSPTLLDTDSDGKVDYAYAGDLDGNVWKFDLRSSTPSSFSVSKLYTTSPADAITTSDPDAKGAFFESPAGKNYRHASYYTASEGVPHL